ncbi:MAG: hypothetical protein HZB51_25530 [Chloroflexi bacterium]|nr:hypothetical protein [Chloroflexota bacterium]
MRGYMQDIAQVKEQIACGKKLLLAGDENLLKQLPSGDWIGGTIPYFMTDQGGLATRDKVYVTELPASISNVSIQVYDEAALPRVYSDAAKYGFSVIIIPAASPTHLSFALNAPNYQDFAVRPLIGWIAGVHLNDLGKVTPKVLSGHDHTALENAAVVMHVALPQNLVAEIGILNIFEQSEGDTITFPNDGFSAQQVFINGVKTDFADYIAAKKLDTRFPLVADYYGAMVNVSFQSVDPTKHKVLFYAPVFAGLRYKHAKPIDNYVQQFTSQMPTDLGNQLTFSCNCILNYLYSELEGKQTGNFTGPITFGEVAYQLLNQTMVYLTLIDLAAK